MARYYLHISCVVSFISTDRGLLRVGEEYMKLNLVKETDEKIIIYRELEVSEQQIAQGKVCEANEAIAKLRDKYGL